MGSRKRPTRRPIAAPAALDVHVASGAIPQSSLSIAGALIILAFLWQVLSPDGEVERYLVITSSDAKPLYSVEAAPADLNVSECARTLLREHPSATMHGDGSARGLVLKFNSEGREILRGRTDANPAAAQWAACLGPVVDSFADPLANAWVLSVLECQSSPRRSRVDSVPWHMDTEAE